MGAKNKIAIVICGPTAVGKTALSIKIAKKYNAAIVSADSRQFYREMNIGTAKPAESELAEVKHHFINNLSIRDTYTVADFEKEALLFLENWFKENDFIVITGGSGLFLNALIYGIDDIPDIPAEIRERLNKEWEQNGLEPLVEKLKKVDPDYYAEADLKNPRRVIRAIEVFVASGKPFSSFRKKKPANRPFNTIWIGIERERDELYQRINERVDQMIRQGLVEEATKLYSLRKLKALQTVGYQELFPFIEDEYTLDTAIEKIKKNSRNYAKRQSTWFRKNEEIKWFHPEKENDISDYIKVKQTV